LLPANVFLCTPKKVGLLPLLLEELHDELASASLLVSAIDGTYQGYSALLDQRLKVDVVNGGEGEVEQVAGQRRYRGEVSVEEYDVQDRCRRRLVMAPCAESGRTGSA
jgi:hypothetical protein